MEPPLGAFQGIVAGHRSIRESPYDSGLVPVYQSPPSSPTRPRAHPPAYRKAGVCTFYVAPLSALRIRAHHQAIHAAP